MKSKKLLKGYLFVIASAVLYGLMPLMAKTIYQSGVNSFTLVFLRNALSLPALAFLAISQQKTLRISRKSLPTIAVAALFGCCATPALLYCSYNFIDSGTATVFHFIYPAMVVLGSILFLKQKPGIGVLLSVLVCVGGICMFYDPAQPLNWQGALLALLSGVTFAVYVLILSVFKDRKSTGFLFSFYAALISAIIMLIFCAATGNLCLPQTLKGWILCSVFALLINACATVMFQQGTFLVGGQRSSILSTMEPITSIVVDAAVFSVAVSLRTGIGAALVVAATIMIALFDTRKAK